MQIPRTLFQTVQSKIGEGKAIIIMGPRQAGKSTTTSSAIIPCCPHAPMSVR